MRTLTVSLGMVAIVSQGFGCGGASEEPGAGEPVGTAAAAQLDGGSKTYTITQGSSGTVAMAWAGTVGGVPVEYWVAKPSYVSTATRALAESSQTCASFRDTVCGSSWSGSTHYTAAYTETTLDCAFPPGPCSPPMGAVSFLGSGSYKTIDRSAAFAWTYSTGQCEYWAMKHTISTGTSSQSPLTPAYTSLSQFQTSVCAMSPVPSTWYTVDYLPDASFCTAPRC